MSDPDAVVVGSGPNGLAAAIVLARAGCRVTVLEGSTAIGGGVRSEALTRPGFVHDVCSAIHPFAVASPFFRSLPLADHGLSWVVPDAMAAHPMDDGPPIVVHRSIEQTAAGLGQDARAYERLMKGLVEDWPKLESSVLGPFRLLPRHPLTLARFGLHALQPARTAARQLFRGERARALLAGHAAHGMLPLTKRPSAAFALVLGALAHIVGWPIPRGGAQSIANALAGYLRALGGTIETDAAVVSLDDLPNARAVLCDLSPRPFLSIAGHRLPDWYRRQLQRYRYGMGVYKIDWALDAPVPWRSEECSRAGTLHLGGPFDEIERSERDPWSGRPSDRPFIIAAQPSLFDRSRAPDGAHTLWTYCHVPHGSAVDMLPAVTAQLERFAPGFSRHVLARSISAPADLERRNPNIVGGDIGAGVMDLSQLFTRPTWRQHATPVRGLYLCSSATPPGVGVHGMCGYLAATRALREVFRS